MKETPLPPAESGSPAQDRSEAIFHGALELPADLRTAYVNQACGDDAQLRARVEILLKANDEAGEFLQDPAPPPQGETIVLNIPPTEKPGDRIGRYKLLQQIGEGGCGVVYMADQEEPVRRRVALKVIKLGMDTKQVVARFEAERQALALMDHPNIAKVLDAGATETGRPFFVMELVRGIKITEYCNQNKLPAEERLKLFMQVCHALQHAHQKGIVHRDIKPSNILVTVNDGVPVPKVIDFGIAKATEQRLTNKTIFTAFEQFIGTPAYMSPEQAAMTSLDIDTRTDIYSLGVLLYELLTGKTPFDAKQLAVSGLDKMRQTIREQDPERPSTRLRTMLNAELCETASHYRIEAPRLISLLRGDLDWIVMKALEKDRTRRYESASGLAMDIQRYLGSETVLARPPSNLYRFQKLVRRNKTVVAAAGAVFLALVAGLAVSVYLLIQERAAHRRAVAAENEQLRMRKEAEQGAALGEKLMQAGLLLSRGNDAEAEKIVTPIPPRPGMVVFYSSFGYFHAREGDWQTAIGFYNKSIAFSPADDLNYYCLAPLLLQVGDIEGYRHCCEQMIHQFGTNSNPGIAGRMAKDCLILPPPTTELDTIRKWVDLAVAAEPDSEGIQFLKALEEYRQGDFPAADGWLQRIKPANNQESPDRRVQIQMLRAMAQYRLGQFDTARTTLATGLQAAEAQNAKSDKGDFGAEWYNWIVASQLTHEASALIPEGAKLDEAKH